MLDERGVEWDDMSIRPYACTSWRDPDGEPCTALEGADDIPDGKLSVQALLTPEQAIAVTLGTKVTGDTSDGYHTFNELYHHRAVLFSVIVRDHQELAWKSMRHHDGTMYEGMFIVGIETPKGQATYHYDIDPYWDMFDCKELDLAPEWDGHTPDDAIERIATLGKETCHRIRGHRSYRTQGGYRIECSECGYGLADRRYRYCPNCGRRIVEVGE